MLIGVSLCLLGWVAIRADAVHLGRGVWVGDTYGRLAVGVLETVPVELSWPRAERREWWMDTGQFMYAGDFSIRMRHLVWAWIAVGTIACALWMHRAFFALRNRRRIDAGVCAACGYDRAGLASKANCPECGAVAPLF